MSLLLSFDENEEEDENHKKISSIEETYTELENIKNQTIKDFNNPNIAIKTKVIEGYPEDVIPAFCNDYSPDLIVMGTQKQR